MTEILREWRSGGLRCVLWRHTQDTLRGCVMEHNNALACVEVSSPFDENTAVRAVDALLPIVSPMPTPLIIDENTPIVDALVVLETAPVPDADRITKPVTLYDDLELIPLTQSSATPILDACDPPGANYSPVDLRRPLYALQRHAPPREPLYGWDPDERLQLCVTLSRLVRPTSMGFAFTARIIGSLTEGRHEIIPGPVRGFGSEAFVASSARDWLSPQDAVDLQALLTDFFAKPFQRSSRLSQAFWYFEYAARSPLIDIRLPLVVTALEALLNTDPDRPSAHFVHRVPLLAALLGLPSISKRDSDEMWKLRSKLVHGAKLGGLGDKDFRLYGKLEEVLRTVLRQAIGDDSLRTTFSSPEEIDRTFPLPPVPAKTVTCPNCGSAVPIVR